MNVNLRILFLLIVSSVILFAGARQEQSPPAKEDVSTGQEPATDSDLARRVEQLESRVDILEKLLFSRFKLEKTRAERLLADRQNRLKNSRALYARGMITESELKQHQLQVEEAEKELELANADSKQQQLASELEVVEAKRRLQVAMDRLTYRKKLAQRGFASKAQVEQMERAVDEAKLRLENAQLKVKSANELDALKK